MTSIPPELEAKLACLPEEVAKLSEQRSTIIQIITSKPRIQKVQSYLRQRPEFAKYYTPKLVAIGPIHRHKDEEKINLEQGEEYKLKWASIYLEGKNAKQLLGDIFSQIETLKGSYTKDAIEGHKNNAELAWMFFVDGSAVLHFIDKALLKSPETEALNIIVEHDLLLLENQLPYEVLMLLSNGDDAKLRNYIKQFLQTHCMVPDQGNTTYNRRGDQVPKEKDQRQPTHLLDLLRTTILAIEQKEKKQRTHLLDYLPKVNPCFQKNENQSGEKNWPTHRNIQELKASGIRIEANEEIQSFTHIHFNRGRLYLSKIMMDDFTAQTFLNMIAYEMCPDFKNNYEISNCVSFLNSLIDHTDDVKELRKAGVLHNLLGSDEEVANIFNTVSTDLVLETGIYKEVRGDIEKHYTNKCKIWMTEIYHNHFSSPWAIIGLAAAFLALFLTVVQTCLAFGQTL